MWPLSLAMVLVLLLLFTKDPHVEGSLPEVSNISSEQLGLPSGGTLIWSSRQNSNNRLPGVCQRLRRRRITILCNSEKYCFRLGRPSSLLRRSPGSSLGQSCRCPRSSRCPRVFIRSFL